MLLKYWEKHRLSQTNWPQELASMGVSESPVIEVIAKVMGEKTAAIVSVYQFIMPPEEPGSLVVCHDLGRGAISLGGNTQWGQWDETYEVLTVDATGVKFNFDGKPVDEGDEGACSLGNI